MKADLDEQTRRMVEVAVSAAPALTSTQITELRRILKPSAQISTVTPLPTLKVATRPTRRAA
ncbi:MULTISPECIES: hypothetical protein [unclassified Actinoplanes]|uniref:hypothetical protein n=1 Tax=unclassified Actinoplanes TaxID=2626549 RepID=UPI0012BAC0EC|nr:MULTISPECIES: hypothetical protein [unclassified Actinoplanes]